MRIKPILASALMLLSSHSWADIAVTGYYGQTGSQEVITDAGTKIDIKDDTNFGFSLEQHDGISKYGLYYSMMSSNQRNTPEFEMDIQYLMFQSAVVMPVQENLSSYLGAQLGVSHISPNFADSDSFFASGLFAGLEYEVIDDLAILGEVRWLATILKNSSKTVCEGTSSGTQCDWYFDGEVMNQFQFNLGLSYRF